MVDTSTIIVCMVLLCKSILSQNVPFDEEEISAKIQGMFQCHKNPGLAVSVVKDGKVLLSRGYGVTDLVTKAPVTNSTVFGVASLSKAFAATLLVKLLCEKTNLTVDSQVQELLGEQFKMPDPIRTKETTFSDLMAHKTAVPPNGLLRYDTNLTRETVLQRLQLLPAPDQFRVKYFYSNLMYGLVSRLSELLGGKSWEDLITEHLFQPLGMDKSTFTTVVNFSRDDVAVAYDDKNGQFHRAPHEFSKQWGKLPGSGALMTTADDMTKWMHFHLYKGLDTKNGTVMSAKLIEELHKPHFLVTPMPGKDTRVPQFPVTSSEEIYALGFRRGYYRGYERLTHSGSTLGYRALLSLLPQQKIGVFTALTGKDDNFKFRMPLHMYLLDRALGLEPWLNVSTICSYPEPWIPKPTASNAPKVVTNVTMKYKHEQYEGIYHNQAYGYIQVSFNETLSALLLTYGWGKWKLHPRSENSSCMEKFSGEPLGITALTLDPVYFLINSGSEDGFITGIKGSAFEARVPPLFDKVGIHANSCKIIESANIVLVLLNTLVLLIIILR